MLLEFSDMDNERRHQQSVKAVNLGLGANIVLSGLKTSVGILGHSPALLADGINSVSDVAYYVVVSIFMRMARKPADDEHPYGHSQLESIAAFDCGGVCYCHGNRYFLGRGQQCIRTVDWRAAALPASPWALYIALLTVGVKLALSFFTRRIGKQTENPAILALAYDHRNDIFSASGAALGIFVGRIGLPWVDPLAGALVALIILRTGVEIVRQSSEELMDAVPNEALACQIQEVLKEFPEVLSIEEVHSHRFGPYLVVNITIGVDGRISVSDGDCIASGRSPAVPAH